MIISNQKNSKDFNVYKYSMYFLLILFVVVLIVVFVFSLSDREVTYDQNLIASKDSTIQHWWSFQSIDTMKFSRDLAREKLNDKNFDKTIDLQVSQIANVGATHIGIATPYDEEFIPFLRRWVISARKHNLKIWFRGNWSGWEGWFDYPKVSREEHITKSVNFVIDNPNLFESGDYFTACPECENGLQGDPRETGNVKDYRNFFTKEHEELQNAFRSINKNVNTSLLSMNGDVAKLVMDSSTTSQLGGVVTIDHYVKTLDKYLTDINQLADNSGGKIILGEIGAPIPDIHGQMNQNEQAEWIKDVLSGLKKNTNVIGISYWVNWGGSTQLWNNGSEPRLAADAVRQAFLPPVLRLRIVDMYGEVIPNVKIMSDFHTTSTDSNGLAIIPTYDGVELILEKSGFEHKKFPSILRTDLINNNSEYKIIVMNKRYGNPMEKILHFIDFKISSFNKN